MKVNFWLADPSLSRDQACALLGVAPDQAQDMVDTIHADVSRLPSSLRKVAGYSTGTPDIQWTAQDWDRFPRARKVRIDQSNSRLIDGDVKDVEPGASSPENAAAGAHNHRGDSTIYCPRSLLEPCKSACAALGLELGPIVAVQWAWASTNPGTLIPGSRLTLADVNADLSVTRPDWLPEPAPRRLPRPRKPPHPKTAGATAGAALGAGIYAILHAAHVHVTPLEAAAISTICAAVTGTITPAKGAR